MTKIEKYLIDTIDFLEDVGLETFLIGSTLLQIVRSGKFRVRHILDQEINLGCLAENLTPEIMKKISAQKEYVSALQDGGAPNYLVFFSDKKPEIMNSLGEPDLWTVSPGFTLLGSFFLKDVYRKEYMGQNNCLAWPKYHLEKLETINYKGHKLKVPGDYRKWLSHYFGPDWEKENLKWNWGSARNCWAFK